MPSENSDEGLDGVLHGFIKSYYIDNESVANLVEVVKRRHFKRRFPRKKCARWGREFKEQPQKLHRKEKPERGKSK